MMMMWRSGRSRKDLLLGAQAFGILTKPSILGGHVKALVPVYDTICWSLHLIFFPWSQVSPVGSRESARCGSTCWVSLVLSCPGQEDKVDRCPSSSWSSLLFWVVSLRTIRAGSDWPCRSQHQCSCWLVQNMLLTRVALVLLGLCREDNTLANGPPKESGMEVMVPPGPVAQPCAPPVPPTTAADDMPPDPCTPPFTCSVWPTDPWDPVGLGPPPQLWVGLGLLPGPPVLSGSVSLASLLSSSLEESDFFPAEPFLAAAAAAAAALSCFLNFARRFWNQT